MSVAGSRVRALIVVSLAIAAGFAPTLAQQVPPPPPPPPPPGVFATNPQQPAELPKGTGIILGQVIDSGTRRGIPGATVIIGSGATPGPTVLPTGEVLMPPGAAQAPVGEAPRQVITDSAGRFMFRSLAAGSYTIRANASPYLAGAFGANRANGAAQMVHLTRSDEKRDGIVIRMWKSATITGTVTDETGEPVIGVSVRSFRRAAQGGRIRIITAGQGTTDDRGVYRLTNMAPGEYFVGVISTQTTMPVPTADAFMQAMYSGAGPNSDIYRELMSSGVSTMLMRGEGGGYRVGDFMVSNGSIYGQGARSPAPLSENRVLTYPSQFYPSASIITQATPISLTSGEDRTSIDLHLKLVPGMRVSGTVTGPDGAVKNLGLRLLPAGAEDFSSDSGIEAASTVTDASGAFTFLGVTPGQYTLKSLRIPRAAASGRGGASSMVEVVGPNGMIMGMSMGPGSTTPPPPPPLPADPVLWATATVTVAEADVNGLFVTVRAGARLAGQIVFDSDNEKPAGAQIQQTLISLATVTSGPSVAGVPRRVEAEGNFATLGYPPGRYLVSATIPSTGGRLWRFKSATSGGRDVSDVGLDIAGSDITDLVITFTDKSTELSGTATNDAGQPDLAASVVVLPADSVAWREGVINTRRIRSARVSTTGSFSLVDLPPGAYFVAAISNDLLDDWQLPSRLEAISRVAVRVTLGDGAKVTQALTTKVIR